MKTIYLSDTDISNFKKYELPKHINHNESDLFLFNDIVLLKLFRSTNKQTIMNKLYILNRLFFIKDNIKINNIIMPEKFIKVNDNSFGYTMKFVKNIDGYNFLNDSNISLNDKIEFLKNIYKIIIDLENNKYLKSINFYLGDIHESNFIYNIKEKTVNAVDIDSVYFDGVNAPNSKFLLFNDKLWDFDKKYPMDENDRHIPNKNTTIISFIYMLLNLITLDYSPNLNTKDFCETLNILYHVGFDKNLCDAIYNIYLPNDNYFDSKYLDLVTPELILKYRELKKVKK